MMRSEVESARRRKGGTDSMKGKRRRKRRKRIKRGKRRW
jgi:hypothetical protein